MSKQLGKALTILARQRAKEDALHLDLATFGGDEDCYAAVFKSEHKRRRTARRHAKAVSGLPYRVLVRKLGKHRLANRAFIRLEQVCFEKATGGRGAHQ